MRLIEFSGRGRPPTTHSPIQKDANFGGKDAPPAMPEVPPMNFGGRRESGTVEFKKWPRIHELDIWKSHALTRVQMFHPHTSAAAKWFSDFQQATSYEELGDDYPFDSLCT